MATTEVRTIGSGGDYSTLQAWEDASPANLVTSDQVWQGQLISAATALSVNGGILSVGGSTVDATRYKELTTAPGASFVDHASKLTNTLRWNSSNGASIECASSYSHGIDSTEAYFRISKLQIRSFSASMSGKSVVRMSATNCSIDKCIIESGADQAVGFNDTNCKASNSLIVRRATGSGSILTAVGRTDLYNCTLAVPSDVASVTYGLRVVYVSGTSTTSNCAIFGATTCVSSTGTLTNTTGRTNQATPPTGFTQVAYDTSSGSGFENTLLGTHDFRIKSSSALIDVGTTDATNAAADIVGTSRPQGSAYDVGAWEYSSGGSAALAGTASGAATATGTMTHGVPLAGAAQGQASASGTLLPDVPGFAFDTDTDCILGEIVGALTGIARETTGTNYIVRAYDVATGALVEESGTLTTDSNGRLPRWQDATLAAATFYQLMFVRVSDGAIGCKLMETS